MSADWQALLAGHLIRNEAASGEVFLSVREAPLATAAREQGLDLAEAMAACLDREIWPERYRAGRGTFTPRDQARLLRSSAAVIGAGGLGGTVSLLLARFGVGRLTICDHDVFDESNLNRQAFSRMDVLGRHKAQVATEAIKAINPALKVRAVTEKASKSTLPDILGGANVVVDCLDNLSARYAVEEAAEALGIPFVHGALAGLEGRLLTVFPGDPGLRGLYGPQPAPKGESAESWLGTPTATPALVAGFQAVETVNLLLGRKPMARHKLVMIDAGVPEIESLNLVPGAEGNGT